MIIIDENVSKRYNNVEIIGSIFIGITFYNNAPEPDKYYDLYITCRYNECQLYLVDDRRNHIYTFDDDIVNRYNSSSLSPTIILNLTLNKLYEKVNIIKMLA